MAATIHNPETSPRKARICPKPECGRRHFGDVRWVCPDHGKAIDQKDHVYFGKVPVLKEPGALS